MANEKHRNELEEIWGVLKGTLPSKPGYHTLEMFKAAVTGDLVNITSRRATCKFKAKINGRGKPMPGMVYVSFHDKEDDRLINKVLLDAFDPGSKQPEYKICAVQVSKAS